MLFVMEDKVDKFNSWIFTKFYVKKIISLGILDEIKINCLGHFTIRK